MLTVLSWGDLQIPIGGYGALLALAILTGGATALHSALRLGLDAGAFIAALAAAVGSGLFGASLLFALLAARTTGTFAPLGLVFYGGAILGGLGFVITARAQRLPLATALDACLPALPVAHALGRLGCWFGGCCYGAAWSGPWSVVYTHPLAPGAHPSVARHPWPLYEAALLLGLAALFAGPRAWLPAHGSGKRPALYVLLYATARMALEPLRGDTIRGVIWGELSTSQCISIALGLGAVLFLTRPQLFARRAAV